MALTQTATIPGPGPSWDEEVVPALRKRLESESRSIARRLSAISISSVEDLPSETYRERTVGSSSYSTSQPFHAGYASRPVQQSRQNSDRSVNSTRVNGASSSSVISPPSRTRTQSQPYRQDSANVRMNNGYSKANEVAASGDTYSISNSSRPLSPNTSIKPSRIPQPTRNRTASLSSNNYTPSLNGRSTSPYSSPYTPAQTPGAEMYQASDLWKVQETESQSQSTISVISRQRSGLLNEQPPFKPPTVMNPSDESLYEGPPRPSTESEERPFEHWYRGDVSRNGGVGELRVGKRQEMMDIANYGHSMKANEPAFRNAITDAIDRRRRKRAGSLGFGDRTSFYMDEEKAEQVDRVLDENPLTDVEGEMSDTGDMSDYQDDEDDTMDVDISMSSAPLPGSNYDGRTTPTPANYSRPSSRNKNAPSRIPGLRTTTPTPPQFQRGMSEPPSLPSSSVSTPPNTRTKQQTQLRSTPTSPNGTPTSNGKRGASPGVASTPSNKKSRLNATKATQAKLAAKKKEEVEAKKKSVANYPSPGEDVADMAHAIPTWTEPVPKQGNWDEVVLPAVARKKGLAGHFEEADGSPKVKKEANTPAPAPGTFGYDHSKYRPPRDGEDIPMDEFGRQEIKEEEPPSHSYASSQQQVQPIHTNPYDETRIPYRPQPPPSPVPFSHYIARPSNGVPTQPTAVTETETKQHQQQQQYPVLEDKDEGGGCCKCVIM